MHVVATAGHVDHGKSTLIRALTGIEPDRWAEERRRGMTIDLGFAWTRLPSGETAAFVDVPGHQRFLANMLAGVGPAPAVLFVVAADEGWRRQSGEHLAAVQALGVSHGLLAVTRSDLGDPSLAIEEAREHLRESPLGDVEAVAVSGATGAGLDELRAALDRLVAGLPAPDPAARVRLWVDRVFTVRGSGTVVTGTLGGGTLRVGAEFEVAPGGRRVRVRGLQSLGTSSEEVTAVARVAVNLRGVDKADVRRGDALVTPATWTPATEVDVRLAAAGSTRAGPADGGPGGPGGVDPAELAAQLVLHVGSAAVAARLRPLGDDTARLTLGSALPLQVGDRALLRDPGEQRVAAGVVVLDVVPPPLRRRGAAIARAVELLDLDGRPDPAGEVARRGAVSRAALAAAGVLAAEEPAPDQVVVAGDWLVAPPVWSAWGSALTAAVDAAAAADPLSAGLSRDAARRAVGLPDPLLLDPLLTACPGLVVAAGRVTRPGRGPTFSPSVERGLAELDARFALDPVDAPEQGELDALGLDTRTLAAAARSGRVLRLGEGVVVGLRAEDHALGLLGALPQPFTTSEARQALGTTRRVVIPLLEHLDSRGRTRRLDGVRRTLVPQATPPRPR